MDARAIPLHQSQELQKFEKALNISSLVFGQAAEVALSRYRQRRLRNRYFEPDLFRDPAWDILLDLFVAHGGRKQISLSSASLAAEVSAATGSRWIAKLEQQGLVERSARADDGRLVYVQITPLAIGKMTELLCRFT
jgi:DNA-binding MarR family transcriptional regulator